jgi:glycosyltransferase involved in cell wall biosynthesis
MKILHLIYDHMNNPWVGGGGAVRAFELCKRLVRKGHEVTIVSGNYPGATNGRDDGINFVFMGSTKNYVLSTFSYACKAASLVSRHGSEFDVIVEDFAPWNPVFSSLLTKKPVVLHINHREGMNLFGRYWIAGLPFFIIERFYPLIFRHVTALSEATRTKIGISTAVIVPPGIDEGFFEDNSQAFSVGDTDRFLIYIGRLHIKNKGLDTLLNAMKDVDTGLLLAGRGKDEGRLKQMSKELSLKNINFAGFVDEREKMNLLRSAWAMVLPSRFEGWGIVVLEAAACGKPVIVSDIPELQYAVDAGFGISFRTGDAKDLAQKAKLLLDNGQMRNDMGQKAREYAKNYTWDNIALDYERFLKEVSK